MLWPNYSYSHSQKDQKLVFKTNYRFMQVKRIAECFNLQGEHSANNQKNGSFRNRENPYKKTADSSWCVLMLRPY